MSYRCDKCGCNPECACHTVGNNLDDINRRWAAVVRTLPQFYVPTGYELSESAKYAYGFTGWKLAMMSDMLAAQVLTALRPVDCGCERCAPDGPKGMCLGWRFFAVSVGTSTPSAVRYEPGQLFEFPDRQFTVMEVLHLKTPAIQHVLMEHYRALENRIKAEFAE